MEIPQEVARALERVFGTRTAIESGAQLIFLFTQKHNPHLETTLKKRGLNCTFDKDAPEGYTVIRVPLAEMIIYTKLHKKELHGNGAKVLNAMIDAYLNKKGRVFVALPEMPGDHADDIHLINQYSQIRPELLVEGKSSSILMNLNRLMSLEQTRDMVAADVQNYFLAVRDKKIEVNWAKGALSRGLPPSPPPEEWKRPETSEDKSNHKSGDSPPAPPAAPPAPPEDVPAWLRALTEGGKGALSRAWPFGKTPGKGRS